MTKKHRRGTLYRRGNVWWLKYNLDGQRIAQSLETENEGEAKRKQVEIMRPLLAAEKVDALAVIVNRMDAAKVEAVRLHDEANPPLTLAQAWDAYVDAENRPRRAGESTLDHYAGHLDAFTDWLKKHHPAVIFMRDVTTEMGAGFIRYLGKKGYTGNRVNKYLQFLRTMFKVLSKPGRISVNPFDDIKRREHLGHTKRPLTVEELKLIIDTADGEYKTLFMVGTFTGLRLGDAATLQWGEVDLVRTIIRRIPHKTARTGQAVIVGIPAILGAHLKSLDRNGPFVIPGIAAEYQRNAPMLSRRIQRHLDKCGIQTIQPGTGEGTGNRAVVIAGYHSLRHSFVSLHAQAGTPQAVLQKLAGHGNPMMTEHYTHIDESTARTTAAALPAILGNTKALPAREPIPGWARELIESMTARTWQKIKKELLA